MKILLKLWAQKPDIFSYFSTSNHHTAPKQSVSVCFFFRIISPCRSLCVSVRDSCAPIMNCYGYPWPRILQCDQFPKDHLMCISSVAHMQNGTSNEGRGKQRSFFPPYILWMKTTLGFLHQTGFCGLFQWCRVRAAQIAN